MKNRNAIWILFLASVAAFALALTACTTGSGSTDEPNLPGTETPGGEQEDDPKYYTITYMNGDIVFETQRVREYGNASMPAELPESSEGEFFGWFKDAAGTTEMKFETIDEDLTLYAIFRKPVLKFSLDSYQRSYIVTGLADQTIRELAIPDQYRNKPVTGIDDRAFFNCGSLRSIAIPDSVTSIGNDSFRGCGSLKDVTIGNGVTSIGKWAFSDCGSLTKIEVAEENDAYCSQDGILYNKAKTAFVHVPALIQGSVTIPDRVTIIGMGEFSYRRNLSSIVIGNGVTDIGLHAFQGCDGLSSITIPKSVENIDSSVFFECTALTIYAETSAQPGGWESGWNQYGYGFYVKNFPVVWDCKNNDVADDGFIYTVQDGIRYGIRDGAATVVRQPANITTAAIPENIGYEGTAHSVTGIGSNAFDECGSLSGITIPDNVTSIGDYAFDGCGSLSGITIPDNVTSIGNGTFRGCNNLNDVAIGNGVTGIGNDAFFGCGSLKSITIPDNVTSIGSGAFSGCNGLNNVAIGNGVTGIGNDAFSGCGSLKSITIPDNVTSLGNGTFRRCNNLNNVAIGNGVTDIGHEAFSGCGSLKSITIGNGVTSIDSYAFSGCGSLVRIEIPNSVTGIGSGAFSGCLSLDSLTIPFVGAKKDGTGSKDFAHVFSGTGSAPPSLKTVVVTGGTGVDSYAFSGCGSLVRIEIPNSVTSIGFGAFSGCLSLDSLTIPFVGERKDGTGATHFGYIFGAETNSGSIPWNLRTVTVTGGTSIGASAFSDCGSLTSVIIPDSVTNIGASAFSDCGSLTSVIIPNGVTSIGENAFRNCYALTIYTEASAQPSGWKGGWSGNCPLVRNCKENDAAYDGSVYIVQDGIRYGIKDGTAEVVRQSSSIATATIVAKISYKNNFYVVTEIQSYAFYKCKRLGSITIPDSVTNIGWDVFSGCGSLRSITIPDGVTSIGDAAFYECRALESITIPSSVTDIDYMAFYDCRVLNRIEYKGTKAEWASIMKGNHWNTNTGNYTVKCGDGTLDKSGNVIS